ncbi:hypothetical protein MFIFM68171_06421 [Madurella fahalii]|uniref:Uncharacterized protein n=1 Tax=Madurella fahalii TaxID=1157608 RepID=A0ABQ0GEN9_9PEZI
MHEVYSNGFCNISASDANGCSESMFSSRNPGVVLPQVIELKIGDQHSDVNRTKLFRVFDDSLWDTNVIKALVNTLAWVFQERFLSPRVIQFGKRLLTWDCLKGPAAEIFPDGLPDLRQRSSSGSFKSFDPSGVASEYSYFNALIAFCGVAKHMAGFLKDGYVAGMWRRYLEGELLWYVEKDTLGRKSSRSAEYRALSWSWASIDGRVSPGTANVEHSLIKVEEVHLDYRTGGETGEVTGGWLRLRGVLKRLRLVRNTFTRRNRIDIGWDMFLGGVKVTIPEEELGLRAPLFVLLDVHQEDFDEENANELLFTMCARKNNRRWQENGDLGYNAMYILLFRLVNWEKAVFERIGVALTLGQEVEETILKIQSPSNAPPAPCLEYRDGMHSICLV